MRNAQRKDVDDKALKSTKNEKYILTARFCKKHFNHSHHECIGIHLLHWFRRFISHLRTLYLHYSVECHFNSSHFINVPASHVIDLSDTTYHQFSNGNVAKCDNESICEKECQHQFEQPPSNKSSKTSATTNIRKPMIAKKESKRKCMKHSNANDYKPLKRLSSLSKHNEASALLSVQRSDVLKTCIKRDFITINDDDNTSPRRRLNITVPCKERMLSSSSS